MRRILRRDPIHHHIWHRVTRKIAVLQGLESVQMARLRELATWLKELPAHLHMQVTYAIDRSAPADRQIGHIETFRRVAAQGQAHRAQAVHQQARPGHAGDPQLEMGRMTDGAAIDRNGGAGKG